MSAVSRVSPNGRGEAPVCGRCVRRVGGVSGVRGGSRISPATRICGKHVRRVVGVGRVAHVGRVMRDGEVGGVSGKAGRFATAFDVRMRAQTHAGNQAYSVACRTGKSTVFGIGWKGHMLMIGFPNASVSSAFDQMGFGIDKTEANENFALFGSQRSV